jgi:hypothetical protein
MANRAMNAKLKRAVNKHAKQHKLNSRNRPTFCKRRGTSCAQWWQRVLE